jgi:tRNA(Ile2) C34 agmatinyltransferase TiaS
LRYLSCDCKRVKETMMNSTKKLAAITALVAALATPSLFADNRRPETTDAWRGRSNDSRRVTVTGRIRDIDRDRNGFVIRLDRGGYTLVVNDARDARRLDRGDEIRATGSVDRGRMYVDRISLLRDDDSNDRSLRGIVTQVDRRGNVVWVELERAGRVVAIDVRRVDRNSRRYDVDDLRRGDRITVRGEWQRNGRFEAERVDVDRGAQW